VGRSEDQLAMILALSSWSHKSKIMAGVPQTVEDQLPMDLL